MVFRKLFSICKFLTTAAFMPKNKILAGIFLKIIKDISKKTKNEKDDKIINLVDDYVEKYSGSLNDENKKIMANSLNRARGLLGGVSFYLKDGKIVSTK